MQTNQKLEILIQAKSSRKANKRNAVPKKAGGRKDAPKTGGGAKAALLRRIHRDPDIQRLLEKNPKYDIIVVRKVQASNEEEAFEKREQAKKDLKQARKDLIGAKKSKNEGEVKRIKAKIAQLENLSTTDAQREQHKKFDDWNTELDRRKRVGGYD